MFLTEVVGGRGEAGNVEKAGNVETSPLVAGDMIMGDLTDIMLLERVEVPARRWEIKGSSRPL